MGRRPSGTGLAAVLSLFASVASAEKLCILPFKGPGADTVRGQLADNLCTTNACVDPKKASKGGKPDFAAGKKQKIDYFITGTIKAKGNKKTLELQASSKPGAPKLKKSVPYSGNALPDKALDALLGTLTRGLGLAAADEKKEEPAKKDESKKEELKKEDPTTDVDDPADKPGDEKKAERKKEKEKDPEEPPPPPKDDERAKEEPPDDDPGPRQPVKNPLVAAELGIELFSRNFSYNNPESQNLRSYSAGLVAGPIFRAELYPLSLITKGLLAGLGIDGAYGTSVGLKSRRSGTDLTWPTTIAHFDASLRFRFRPVADVDAAVIPFVGICNRSFSVGPASDGTVLDGLPNVSYTALRPGIAGELPFSNSGFLVFAKFAVQIVLSSGQIISPAAEGFFKSGSNFGIEGQLGAGYRIFGPLSVRLAFDFVRYGLGFTADPTATYRAGGAVDTYLGGNLVVRLTF